MKRWLAELAPRDRLALGAGAVALAAVLAALLVWAPLDERREALERRAETQARTLAWMQDAARRVEAGRRAAGGTAEARNGRSLLALVDATAREAGLAETLRRAEPAGGDGVRVWLDAARYADVAAWMETLAGRHGLRITELGLDRAGQGRVNARLTVVEPRGS